MALMENVKRIKEAKAALKTAIKDKGVIVPDDALLSEYPALVEKIETAADELTPIYEIVFDIKTQSMTSFLELFKGYKGEDLTVVRKLDTSKVKNFKGAFSECSEITELDLSTWDVSSATNMYNMFYRNEKLESLDLSTWDVSSVENMGSMFYMNKKLKSLDLSSWDVGNVIRFDSFCTFCSALEDFKAPKNIKTSIKFDFSGLINYESLMSIINNLAPVETTQTLTLGSDLLNKLSAEDIAIATQKGWTVK